MTTKYHATYSGRVLRPGDSIANFRGEIWLYQGVYSGGRKVLVSDPDWPSQREFFPSVFPGLEVRPSAE